MDEVKVGDIVRYRAHIVLSQGKFARLLPFYRPAFTALSAVNHSISPNARARENAKINKINVKISFKTFEFDVLFVII